LLGEFGEYLGDVRPLQRRVLLSRRGRSGEGRDLPVGGLVGGRGVGIRRLVGRGRRRKTTSRNK